MTDSARADVWTWAVRLFKSRALASAACKAGHVSVNGKKVKPAHSLGSGDRVEALTAGGVRIVEVRQVITKRVGATSARECYVDHSPPPPPKELRASAPRRDPGSGRPSKRDRRAIERLRGR